MPMYIYLEQKKTPLFDPFQIFVHSDRFPAFKFNSALSAFDRKVSSRLTVLQRLEQSLLASGGVPEIAAPLLREKEFNGNQGVPKRIVFFTSGRVLSYLQV